jgi:hypothetical protein
LISVGISSLSSETRKNEVIDDYNKFVGFFPIYYPNSDDVIPRKKYFTLYKEFGFLFLSQAKMNLGSF